MENRKMFASTLLLCLIGTGLESNRASFNDVPKEFIGVWQVKSATENGTNVPLAKDPDGSLSVGECGFLEIIVSKSRIVIVQTSGEAIVARAKVIAEKPEIKIELKGFGYHAKRDGPSYCLLKKTKNDEIQFAFCESDADRLDITAGGEQFVLTARSEDK